MATPLQDIQAARPNTSQLQADLKSAMEKVSSAFLETLSESLKTFEKNELKSRKDFNQLKMNQMKEELKKRGIVETEITKLEKLHLDERYREFNKHYEKTKKALNLNLTELQAIEKKQMQQRISQNKEFYGKIDSGFKKFNEGMGRVAGTLDSVLGTKGLFSLVSKVAGLATTAFKGVFKMAMGGAKFLSSWREEGIGKAFQQTKIGQGVSKVGSAARSAKDFITGSSADDKRKGKDKDFITGSSADDKRKDKDKEMQAAAAQDKVMKAAKGTTDAVVEEGKREEKQRKKWWAWEILKFAFMKTLDIGKALLGLGKAPWIASILKWMGPVAIGVVLGYIANRLITGIANSISENADKTIDAIYKSTTEEKTRREKDKKALTEAAGSKEKYETTRAETAKDLQNNPEMLKLRKERDKQEKIRRRNTASSSSEQLFFTTINKLWPSWLLGNDVSEAAEEARQNVEEINKKIENLRNEAFTKKLKKTQPKSRKPPIPKTSKNNQPTTTGESGDPVFDLDQKMRDKGFDTSQFTDSLKDKYKTSKEFLGNVFKRPSSNAESSRSLTIPSSTVPSSRRKGKSIALAPGVNFDGLRSNVKDKFSKMSDEYFDKTGHVVGVNSALRTMADQVRLYHSHPGKAAKPGRSPHQYGYAIDANSWNLNEMDNLGLLDKYGFERKARMRSGELETWHITPKGETREVAPVSPTSQRNVTTDYEAGDDVFGKVLDYKVIAKYLDAGKQLSETAVNAVKNISYVFSKDGPGKGLKDLQKTKGTVEEKDSKEMIKLLTNIHGELSKAKRATETQGESKAPAPTPAPSSQQGGSAGYKTQGEVFPSDTMMTNMYALITQFSGGY